MRYRFALLAFIGCFVVAPVIGQNKKAQAVDEEYTKLIKQYLQDSRVTTELVDHMPASETVPSPLKFFGRIPGTPGELTYAKDIYRYYEALAKASPRARFCKIGQTETGGKQGFVALPEEHPPTTPPTYTAI